MATQDIVLIGAIAVAAMLNWWSVARGDYTLERLTKPTVIVLLVGLAWSLGTDDRAVRAAALVPVLVALALSLVGDVLLLTATQVRFTLGLAAFLGAHLAYLWATVVGDHAGAHPWLLVLALPVIGVIHGRWGRDVVRHAGALRAAVLAYELALVLLVLVACVLARPVVALGALVFLVSDLVLGHDRFVLERRWAPVQVMVSYHLAQLLLVLGLLA